MMGTVAIVDGSGPGGGLGGRESTWKSEALDPWPGPGDAMGMGTIGGRGGMSSLTSESRLNDAVVVEMIGTPE